MRAPALAAAKACGGLSCFVDQQDDVLAQRGQCLEAFMFGLTFGVPGHLISPLMPGQCTVWLAWFSGTDWALPNP